MSEEGKYPIKFAVLELKERGGWAVGYKDVTLGYITSKCYVIESSIKYRDAEISHKVVFPFKNINIEMLKLSLQKGQKYYIGEKTIPSYNACGEPCHADIVSNLFESYEDAKKEAEIKNKELVEGVILQVPIETNALDFEEKYESLKRKAIERITICQAFEQLVTLETADMVVSSEVSEKKAFQLLNKKKY